MNNTHRILLSIHALTLFLSLVGFVGMFAIDRSFIALLLIGGTANLANFIAYLFIRRNP